MLLHVPPPPFQDSPAPATVNGFDIQSPAQHQVCTKWLSGVGSSPCEGWGQVPLAVH